MTLASIVPPERLGDWLASLSNLETFWTKRPLEARWDEGLHCLAARVLYRGRPATYTLADADAPAAIPEPCFEARLPHAVLPEGPAPPHRSAALLYFWRPPGSPLAGNPEVEVEAAESPGEVAEAAVLAERVQRSSWRMYFPPQPGVHTVFIARLRGEPVAAAYYNRLSFNIDYGVHVARPYWRRRIGSRLLGEILRYAAERGDPWVSVVRVLGVKRPRPGDAAATAFYAANRPAARLRVYRLGGRTVFTRQACNR